MSLPLPCRTEPARFAARAPPCYAAVDIVAFDTRTPSTTHLPYKPANPDVLSLQFLAPFWERQCWVRLQYRVRVADVPTGRVRRCPGKATSTAPSTPAPPSTASSTRTPYASPHPVLARTIAECTPALHHAVRTGRNHDGHAVTHTRRALACTEGVESGVTRHLQQRRYWERSSTAAPPRAPR